MKDELYYFIVEEFGEVTESHKVIKPTLLSGELYVITLGQDNDYNIHTADEFYITPAVDFWEDEETNEKEEVVAVVEVISYEISGVEFYPIGEGYADYHWKETVYENIVYYKES